MNPGDLVKQGTQSADTGYTYYPWSADTASTTPNTGDASPVTAPSGTTGTQTQTQQPQSTTPQSTGNDAALQPTSSSLFKVRVGSFADRDEAVEVSKELEEQGYPVYVTGASPYSIQVGAFSSMENAVNLSEQLSDQGYTSSVVK